MKPFRHPTADKLGALSLITLVCVAVINLTAATLSSSATEPEGPDKHVMVVLRDTERRNRLLTPLKG
ncbi:hypothetical protein pdam_00021021 [Pocillopora damicornis]|uniref:Uncharacterized protein n=1 Tax=Pocillopora damicornis TaxID=46731 RepID=A0A3M6UQM7_POCDA|nr:hypothetical protein pdam_00021021 [Pocillopora damicornis]